MEYTTLKPKARGRRFWGESEIDGWTEWALLDAAQVEGLNDDDILCLLDMTRHYSGPGRYFSHVGYVQRSRNRVLVRQRCGYDI